ncbi:hypothetical protein DL98DRAFT_565080 [Cadophora sp. DSE1049]|nr:hypothetical protein DL98DRAFT_565080 [Cadophora sp. DSE1049]
MSTTGGDGGGNMAGAQADAITLAQDTKETIDRLLTFLEEGNGYFSQAEVVRALGADSQNYLRSVDSPSPAVGSATREHVVQTEEGQAGAEATPQPEPEPQPEPAVAEIDPGGPSTTAVESPDSCTICFEEISTLCMLQPCDHKFDMDCLMPWLVSVYTESHDESALRCPLCRQPIETIRHSIIGDGTATVMVVGPHFRQQFSRHGLRRLREDLMRPLNGISLYRVADDLGERFPGNGIVASYLPNGPLIDELRRRQRAELRLNAQRSDVQPTFVREDHISDEAFERMSTQDILDMIDRRESLNAARERELEAMGEGASMDLHIGWRRPSGNERQGSGSAATRNTVRSVASLSSPRTTMSPLWNLVSTLERQDPYSGPPPRRITSTGATDEIGTSREYLRRIIHTVVEEVIRRAHDERERAPSERILQNLQERQ